jgi:hypothetical protein
VTTTSSTRTAAARIISADPTSTALLLAGPTALELWPGVRRVGSVGGLALVETELPREPRTTAATVRALPPRRTPTSFVTRFAFSGPNLPSTTGVLTLAYGSGAVPCTDAHLVLVSDGVPDSGLDAVSLRRQAEQFLANLADAAEQRSRAA